MSLSPLHDALDGSVRNAVATAARRAVHPSVLDAISVSTEAQRTSLAALREGICVVTGQQAGLFGGPMYTLHKAAACIVNARALEEATGIPCAPVFWLQDEDHDFDEIAAVTVLGSDGEPVRLSVDGLDDQEGCSVAFRQFGPSIEGALDGMAGALGELPHADEVLALIRDHHGPRVTIADAFRRGIERLFAAHGLLVVDPMHPALVEAAGPVHDRAVSDAVALAQVLQRQAAALEAAGRPVPVHVRDASPLSFVHPDGLEGPRVRVEPEGDGWTACGTGGTVAADTVTAGPHTTSALLRPILQDTLLPTAAYVGGPGELAYLAQLPPLWDAFDLPMPLVVERAHVVFVDPSSRRALTQLGLTPSDLNRPRHELLAQVCPDSGEHPDPDALFAAITTEALAALDTMVPHAEALGANLPKSVAKTKKSLLHGVGKLVDRYRRTLATRDQPTIDRLDRVLTRLMPDGAPQERVFGWPGVAARIGIDAMVQSVLDAVEPFDSSMQQVDL